MRNDSLADGTTWNGRFVVSAAKWPGGWDLYIDGDGLHSGGGVTQVTSLDDADAQVRSYLRSVFQSDFSNAVIEIVLPDDTLNSHPDCMRMGQTRP